MKLPIGFPISSIEHDVTGQTEIFLAVFFLYNNTEHDEKISATIQKSIVLGNDRKKKNFFLHYGIINFTMYLLLIDNYIVKFIILQLKNKNHFVFFKRPLP